MSDDYEVLTIDQVATELQVSTAYVYREVRAGRLVGTKLGRTVRITRGNLRRFLDARSSPN